MELLVMIPIFLILIDVLLWANDKERAARLLSIMMIPLGLGAATIAFYPTYSMWGMPQRLLANRYWGPGILTLYWPSLVWLSVAVVGLIILANDPNRKKRSCPEETRIDIPGKSMEDRIIEIEQALLSSDPVDRDWAMDEIQSLPENVACELRDKHNLVKEDTPAQPPPAR